MLYILELIGGWSLMIFILGLFLINAAYMLVDPRKWMTTRRWYFNQGALLYRRRYITGKGDWELRIGGALTIAFFAYVVTLMLLR